MRYSDSGRRRPLGRLRWAAAALIGALAISGSTACAGRAGGTSAPTLDPTADSSITGTEVLGQGPADPGEGSPDVTAEPEGPGAPQGPEDESRPAPEDCVSYDPSNLTVEASGDAWRLRDGNHSMRLFDTKTDADNGRAVASGWTWMCFIGRGNDRPDRYRYIVTYWRGPNEDPYEVLQLLPLVNCVSYQPSQLAIYSGAAHPANPDQSDWALHSGATPLVYLATEADALRAKLIAGEHTKLCIIGHGNDRPDPYRYVMHYWAG